MKTSNINVTLLDSCGSDITVVNAARVSFHKESTSEVVTENWDGIKYVRFILNEKDTKLIQYLAKHEHKSPFNHAFLSFRVKAPIFVARQLVKHKFLPWNEVSRRYVDEEPEFYYPEKWRLRSADKKQGSSCEGVDSDRSRHWHAGDKIESLLNLYNEMIADYCCPEQARMVLPQNMMTEWIWSGTLGAFCDMLRLRLKEDTQEETRQVAELIYKEIKPLFPVSVDALLKGVKNV